MQLNQLRSVLPESLTSWEGRISWSLSPVEIRSQPRLEHRSVFVTGRGQRGGQDGPIAQWQFGWTGCGSELPKEEKIDITSRDFHVTFHDHDSLLVNKRKQQRFIQLSFYVVQLWSLLSTPRCSTSLRTTLWALMMRVAWTCWADACRSEQERCGVDPMWPQSVVETHSSEEFSNCM